MTTDVPEAPEELTADWLRVALGWSVQGVEQRVLGEGVGFLGDIVRLTLSSDDPRVPDSVIAKLPKKANRATGEMLGVYEREIMFFQDLAPTVPARTPRIFFSHYDRDAGSEKQKQILRACDSVPGVLTPLVAMLGARIAAGKKRRYLLIMEDLGQLEVGDQWVGATLPQCEQVLSSIAETHRAFWGSGKLQELFWLLPMDIDARMRHRIFTASYRAFRSEASEEMRSHLDWLAVNGARLMRSFVAEAPHTLVHNDLRLDNVCFGPDRCTMLDWQLTRLGPAAYDVAYFVGGAMAPETPHAEEKELIREYHRMLDAPDYPFDSMWRDYQRGLMLTAASVVPAPNIEIDRGRGQEMMERWRGRLTARLRAVDAAALL